MRARRLLRPLRPNTFRPPRGQKAIYLPNFTLTLLRTPHLPPHFASFITPLSLNKLDLKDYLYNAYSIPVLSVRSFIQQQRVTQDRPGVKLPGNSRWFRGRSVKKMTVEMAGEGVGRGKGGAFVWPEEEEDLDAWDKETYDKAKQAQKEQQELLGPNAALKPKKDGKTIAEQAKALLQGKESWRPSWKDYGMAREMEVGVDVNAVRR